MPIHIIYAQLQGKDGREDDHCKNALLDQMTNDMSIQVHTPTPRGKVAF